MAPSAGVSKGPKDSSTQLGPNSKHYSGTIPRPPVSDVLPGTAVTSTKRVPFGATAGLKAPLGPREINYAITGDEMSKQIGTYHSAVKNATDVTESLMNPIDSPYIDDATAQAFNTVADSAAMQRIIANSISQTAESSGVNQELLDNVKNIGKPTGAHAKYAESIKDNNKIIQASRRLVSANKNFYNIVESECPYYVNNEICKQFRQLQGTMVNEDFNEMVLKNLEYREKIANQIKINNDRKLAIMRMKELLGDRLQELSELEKKINKLDTDINVNTRNNYYNSLVKNNNRNWQSYIIFMYYEIFLVYILISNFFQEGNYKKIIPLLLLLLYILFPILMNYLTILMQNIMVNIEKNFGNYPRHVKTI